MDVTNTQHNDVETKWQPFCRWHFWIVSNRISWPNIGQLLHVFSWELTTGCLWWKAVDTLLNVKFTQNNNSMGFFLVGLFDGWMQCMDRGWNAHATTPSLPLKRLVSIAASKWYSFNYMYMHDEAVGVRDLDIIPLWSYTRLLHAAHICGLNKPAAEEKSISYPAKIRTVMSW